MSPLVIMVDIGTSGAHNGEQILKFIQSLKHHMTSIPFGFLKYSSDCVFTFLMTDES